MSLLLLPIVGAMLHGAERRGKRCSGVVVMLLGFTLTAVAGLELLVDSAGRAELLQGMKADWWNSLDTGDGSTVATAARIWFSDQHPAVPANFLAWQWENDPLSVSLWFARRLWRTAYAMSDGRMESLLLALELVLVSLAAWGLLVASRNAVWRWLAVIGGLFVMTHWGLAAMADPLARNLTPIGGILIFLALPGVNDLYQRIVGRSLISVPSTGDSGCILN